ncbi:hypothetical protein [Arcobacter sp. CECT 8985]|uniref:hypothetical protein n=1 Tax=Arcobacter sp. CECT 8985 TaxID=1935424 RepID=UPI00100A78AE|nr:hypothetical protein [Arcobacter sp. CECT 8985]RXJ86374.1 hypothetical protein CRU93_08785 [Arcobacter sp. CECT 8985]
MNNQKNLFISTFIVMICTYLYIFGEEKTINLISKEYIYIIAFTIVSLTFCFFKFKLKDFQVVEFIPTNNVSLKSTVIFFIIFEIYDYFSEDGFKGMISQWFIYWILGVTILILTHTINYYKNYQILRKIS